MASNDRKRENQTLASLFENRMKIEASEQFYQ